MRIQWSEVLLLVASSGMPLKTHAAPCADGKCSTKALVLRDALPGFPIIPIIPKPVVVPKPIAPIAPKPIPIAPKPVPADPVPAKPPKPQEPAPPKPQEPAPPGSGKAREDPAAVTDDNPCGIVAARSLDKRERVPDDAAKYKEVFLWLLKESNVDRHKLVFWADSDKFREKAAEFARANGYRQFWDIFDNKFMDAFALREMDSGVNQACSRALALYAKDPVVFNFDNAPKTSYWTTIEYPKMYRAGTITKLKDDAKTPADNNGRAPIPPPPSAGGSAAGSC